LPLSGHYKRETDLIATNPTRVPPLANPPFAPTAHMGRLTGAAKEAAAVTAARTVPPREHGGNCDIKDLSRGATVYFPVYVPGAGLSMGDLHFSQGDGEITFCGAIEMAGWTHLRVNLIKDGVAKMTSSNLSDDRRSAVNLVFAVLLASNRVCGPLHTPLRLRPKREEHACWSCSNVSRS
jgi:acetamidase/formamidase